MAALDWLFVALLLVSMLIGAWRGLVYELLSVLGWVLSFFLAQWFGADVAALLPMDSASDGLRNAAGFALVFVVTVFACGLVAWMGKKLVNALGLRPVDRSLGAAFGALRGLILLLAVAVVAGLTPLHQSPWWQESRAAPLLGQLLRGLQPLLPMDLLGKHLPPALRRWAGGAD